MLRDRIQEGITVLLQLVPPYPVYTQKCLFIERPLARHLDQSGITEHDIRRNACSIVQAFSHSSEMLEKGLVQRDDTVRPQLFRPAATQERTQKRMLKDLIQKVYDGSAGSLVLQALASQKATPEELAEIRRVLGEMGDSES